MILMADPINNGIEVDNYLYIMLFENEEDSRKHQDND